MYNKLIEDCLHFPDKRIKEETITDDDRNKAKNIILRLVGKGSNHIDNLNRQFLTPTRI